MSSPTHMLNKLNLHRTTTYNIRRENNDNDYINNEIDRYFYIQHYDYMIENDSINTELYQDLKRYNLNKLDIYGKNIRTGNEFFITQELLNYFLEKYLNPV